MLRKLDKFLYSGERALAGALFLVMALVMFLSVLHRIFSREEGRLAALAAWLLRAFGARIDRQLVYGPLSAAIVICLAFFLSYAALRTMRRARPFDRLRALGLAALLTLGLILLVRTLLSLFPNGLVWGPAVALSCMLWVSFLGASMATYERRHLALELGEKIWPRRAVPVVQAVAVLFAASVSGFLMLLSLLSIHEHLEAWAVNHLAGNLLPTEIPKWTIFLIFPYTFMVMSARLLAQAFDRRAGQ